MPSLRQMIAGGEPVTTRVIFDPILAKRAERAEIPARRGRTA